MTPTCDIVVLTWNKIDVTKNFVQSFLRTTLIPARIIFIDNNSNDGTGEYLKSLSNTPTCQFEVILNKENVGFVRGVNQGLKLAKAPFVCIANNDLTFTNGWLEEMIDLMTKRLEIGLLNPNSNNLGVHPPQGILIAQFSFDLQKRFKGRFEELSACIGFCMLTKKEILEKVGGLSEEFIPMFFEDTDLSRRVSKAGYRVGMAKGSYVWHQEHSSIDQMGDEKQRIFEQSQRVFLKKWGRTLRIAWVLNNEDLLEQVKNGIQLGRDGNFVWFMVEGLTKSRQQVFEEAGCDEFSDVKFVRYRFFADLVWKIVIKKKKFDVIICDDRAVRLLLKIFGQRQLFLKDFSAISELKRAK